MSFCRFSSDNFRCDVYLYADCSGGYSLHVAGGRYKEPIPEVPVPPVGKDAAGAEWQAFFDAHKAQGKYLETAATDPIELPYAGENWFNISAEEVLERLTELRGLGYRFPDYVLESMREEIAEQNDSMTPSAREG